MKKNDNDTKPNCCQVDSVITIDERGQMVLPKDLREKAGLKPGDKLAVITWQQEGNVCCISLVKAERLAGMVKNVLSPMVQDLG